MNIDEKLYVIKDLGFLNKTSVKELVEAGKFVIFPHEWENKSEQIISHINSYNNPTLKKVYARKCKVKDIPLREMKKFCQKYHIQGFNSLGIIAWGLYHDNDLIGTLSLGRHHRQSEDILLDRLCFRDDVRVVGGASKLFSSAKKWAVEQGLSHIVSFSDNRWSLGSVYNKLGFKLDKEMPVDYFYVDINDYTKFYSKQSQKKSNTGCPASITEKEWSYSKGLIQIYDAGKKRWICTLRLERNIKNPLTHRRHGYYKTKKAGTIYYQSSYELRAAYLLDNMDEVLTFNTQVKFKSNGQNRYIDFLVVWKNTDIEIIEVKPKRKLTRCKKQIDANVNYAKKQGWKFTIWTEEELGFSSEYKIKVWSDAFISSFKDVDLVNERKFKSTERSKKFYETHIATDKIEVWCEYCNEHHYPLRLTAERNIAKNGKYICERYGGHLAGKRPKKKKENPYVDEGKKKCNRCSEVKFFSEFGTDKIKSDGYSTRCKKCRAEVAIQKYRKKKS